MARLYIALALIALVGGGAWAIIAKMNRQAATIAVQDVQIRTQAGEIVGLKVSAHEKQLNNDALRRANNTVLRTTRDAKQSSAEGLNDDTHNDTTYISSFNRAWSASVNGVRGETRRNQQPDNH